MSGLKRRISVVWILNVKKNKWYQKHLKLCLDFLLIFNHWIITKLYFCFRTKFSFFHKLNTRYFFSSCYNILLVQFRNSFIREVLGPKINLLPKLLEKIIRPMTRQISKSSSQISSFNCCTFDMLECVMLSAVECWFETGNVSVY